MTQDVEPLTWQKRTNLEEHQQFFSKINEIIANLAPTVDEAEQAIAQATQAIADANAAIATANAASAAADAAAQQAQTAAATVAGYDTRLTAAEGGIDALQAADQTLAGSITALGTRMTAAESKNSQQDTAIGTLQTADGQNVKINAINDYAVGLSGNQGPILGIKDFEYAPKSRFNGSQGSGSGWFKLWESEASTASTRRVTILNVMFRQTGAACQLIIVRRVLTQNTVTKMYGNTPQDSIIVTRDESGKMTLWTNTTRTSAWVVAETVGTSRVETSMSNVLADDSVYSEPQVADYAYLVRI